MVENQESSVWVEQSPDGALIVVNDPLITLIRVQRNVTDSEDSNPIHNIVFELASLGSDELTEKRRRTLNDRLRNQGLLVAEYHAGDVLGIILKRAGEIVDAMKILSWPSNTQQQVDSWLKRELTPPEAMQP